MPKKTDRIGQATILRDTLKAVFDKQIQYESRLQAVVMAAENLLDHLESGGGIASYDPDAEEFMENLRVVLRRVYKEALATEWNPEERRLFI